MCCSTGATLAQERGLGRLLCGRVNGVAVRSGTWSRCGCLEYGCGGGVRPGPQLRGRSCSSPLRFRRSLPSQIFLGNGPGDPDGIFVEGSEGCFHQLEYFSYYILIMCACAQSGCRLQARCGLDIKHDMPYGHCPSPSTCSLCSVKVIVDRTGPVRRRRRCCGPRRRPGPQP